MIHRGVRLVALSFVAMTAWGCNDPADFTPVKGAADFPSTSTAYRVFSVASDCVPIGKIEHATSIQGVAATVAHHGGTHYLVTDERLVEEYVTSGQSLGGAAYAQQGSSRSRTKQISAEAYRCPPRTRSQEPRAPSAEAAPPPPIAPPVAPVAPPPVEPVADAGSD